MIAETSLIKMRFRNEDITVARDPHYDDLQIIFSETMVKVLKNHKAGVCTLVYVYYSGHGVCDNQTYAVDGKGEMFAIEQ